MKLKLILFFFLLSFAVITACKSSSKIRKEESSHKLKSGFYENYSRKLGYQLNGSEDKIFLETVVAWLGVPYKYGGCSKDGTDCSCFVSCFYREVFGINLPRKSEDMQQQSKTIEKETLQQGDLVFFKIAGEKVSHVGIYISQGHFVHATTYKGVMINSLEENYYKKYFHKAGRIEK
ncbi:MAG: C40 family peptidase [Bacteroidales bacterium]